MEVEIVGQQCRLATNYGHDHIHVHVDEHVIPDPEIWFFQPDFC
ncbi:MAG TPA: hypothetical protein VGQ81_03505 [Acidobacteriota bacterium]|nr:hypothetical protein [Acidobacteriota bacterium]